MSSKPNHAKARTQRDSKNAVSITEIENARVFLAFDRSQLADDVAICHLRICRSGRPDVVGKLAIPSRKAVEL